MQESEEHVRRQYEQEQAWVGLRSATEQARVAFSNSLIPQDARSVLDAGCGNGAITNLIASGQRERLVVGCDLSLYALQQVHTHRVQCSLRRLPFVADSFDVVTAFEVIEHVPLEGLDRVLQELQRVARRWIIVSFPYRERLWAGMVKCQACRTVFHAYGHHTVWSERSVRSLFAGSYKLVKVETFRGVPGAFGTLPNTLYWAQRVLGEYWPGLGHAVCPRCGSPDRAVLSGNCLGWLLSRVIWRLERVFGQRKPSHIFAVYERQEG